MATNVQGCPARRWRSHRSCACGSACRARWQPAARPCGRRCTARSDGPVLVETDVDQMDRATAGGRVVAIERHIVVGMDLGDVPHGLGTDAHRAGAAILSSEPSIAAPRGRAPSIIPIRSNLPRNPGTHDAYASASSTIGTQNVSARWMKPGTSGWISLSQPAGSDSSRRVSSSTKPWVPSCTDPSSARRLSSNHRTIFFPVPSSSAYAEELVGRVRGASFQSRPVPAVYSARVAKAGIPA